MARAKLTDEQKEIKRLRKALVDLTRDVGLCLSVIDGIMRERESHERGRRIAQACNALEMAKDRARIFGLGEDWRKAKVA